MGIIKSLVLFAFCALSFSQPALAWPPTYGVEFNFTCLGGGSGLRPTKVQFECAVKLKEQVLKRCPGCSVREHPGKFGFTEFEIMTPEGFEFNISVDSKVVEIQTFPQTLKKIEKSQSFIQQYIFESAAEAGLFHPSGVSVKDARFLGKIPTHFNVGIRSSFGDSPNSFLRFYADYANQPGLGTGILGNFKASAMPLSMSKASQRNALEKLVIKGNQGYQYKLGELGLLINQDVHTWAPKPAYISFFQKTPRSSILHNQAIGMKALEQNVDFRLNDLPFEFRSVRQFKNAKEFFLFAEMMEKQIEYTKAQTGPIVYLNRAAESWEKFESGRMREILFDEGWKYDFDQAFTAHNYLTRAKLDWQKYAPLLSDEVLMTLNSGELQRIFGGNIDWSNKQDRFIFEKLLVRDAPLSEFNTLQFIHVFENSQVPPEIAVKALEKLLTTTKTSPTTESTIKGIFKRLQESTHLQTPQVKAWLEKAGQPKKGAFGNCLGKIFR